jgi:ABC-type protease/lipase transport system fused ATPase/permease subunit
MNIDILFERVCCGEVLKDASFHVEGNSVVALAGGQDFCKAVMELITGKQEPEGGYIRIGGKDPCLYDGLVYTAECCPTGTIYQHIAGDRTRLQQMKVLEAAAAAMVLDFTWEMRDGINSPCEMLTAEQRLCVGIARAMLEEAPVVVMNGMIEEDGVWEAVKELAKEKIVVVAGEGMHVKRLSDVIVVLKNNNHKTGNSYERF